MHTISTQQADFGSIISEVNRCIQICADGERGYAISAADARSPVLKALFLEKALERSDFVLALQGAVRDLGGLPIEGTERFAETKDAEPLRWSDGRFENRTDRMILEDCERGEQAAQKAYTKAFLRASLETLPRDVRLLMHHQHETIQSAVEEARSYLELH